MPVTINEQCKHIVPGAPGAGWSLLDAADGWTPKETSRALAPGPKMRLRRASFSSYAAASCCDELTVTIAHAARLCGLAFKAWFSLPRGIPRTAPAESTADTFEC